MKRMNKIERLAEIGYSATELHHMSNELLDATYDAARPIIQQKHAEMHAIRMREKEQDERAKHRLSCKQQRDDYQRHQRALEQGFLSTWKPVPKIVAHVPKKEFTRDDAKAMIQHYKEEFRRTGDITYAHKANTLAEAIA